MLYRIFQRLFFGESGQTGQPSVKSEDSTGRNAACSRLRLVLMHDRTQIEPDQLDQLRIEMVALISKYIPIDQEAIELNLEKDPETNTVALVANIPVLHALRKPTADTPVSCVINPLPPEANPASAIDTTVNTSTSSSASPTTTVVDADDTITAVAVH
jgi:cell division topological specificity factor